VNGRYSWGKRGEYFIFQGRCFVTIQGWSKNGPYQNGEKSVDGAMGECFGKANGMRGDYN